MFSTNKKAYFLLFSQYEDTTCFNQIALNSVSYKKRKV